MTAAARPKRLTFWGADEYDDSLVREVIAGHKTVTADVAADYYAGYGELGDGGYVAGDLIEVLDGQRRPRCLIRATRVEIIRFGHIPEPVWRWRSPRRAGVARRGLRQRP